MWGRVPTPVQSERSSEGSLLSLHIARVIL